MAVTKSAATRQSKGERYGGQGEAGEVGRRREWRVVAAVGSGGGVGVARGSPAERVRLGWWWAYGREQASRSTGVGRDAVGGLTEEPGGEGWWRWPWPWWWKRARYMGKEKGRGNGRRWRYWYAQVDTSASIMMQAQSGHVTFHWELDERASGWGWGAG